MPPADTLEHAVDVGGYVLRGERLGPFPTDPDTVVLVHGVGVSRRNLRPAGRCLAARGFTALVPDLPGHGDSDDPGRILDVAELADALAAYLQAVGAGAASFVGNSFGCQVIAELAVRHPERVTRAVLQGPTCDPLVRGWLRQTWRWVRNGLRERSTQHEVTFGDWKRAGLRRLIVTARHSLRHPIERRLPEVRAPVLVVRGDRDPIVPQRWAEEAARLAPRGQLLLLPGATHTATTTDPERFAEAVTPFLLGDRDR